MNEEIILNDILLCEKNISNNYSIAINEMSNKTIYKKILKIFEETKNLSRELFNYMYSIGFYNLECENENKINNSYNKYLEKLNEMY